ncbi:MAG: hypothetical protein QM504_07825 [Pseudomonadota bacterium]
MNEFLKIEYEQCLALIKYYDERHHSLVKYASGLSGAIPSLLLAIFQLGEKINPFFWQFTFIISLLTTIGLLSIFTVLIQTRLYFIYPARQVNSIRKHSLDEFNDCEFKNQMYLNTTFNAFKWSSSQTLLNLLIVLQIGVFTGLTVYGYMLSKGIEVCVIGTSLSSGILMSIILFGTSSWYLYKNSKYHPDKSIHKEKV